MSFEFPEILLPTLIVSGTVLVLLAIIYTRYKIESKRLALIERGILKPEAYRQKESILISGFLLASIGAAILLGSFISSDVNICTKAIASFIPLFAGVALLILYPLLRRTETSVKN